MSSTETDHRDRKIAAPQGALPRGDPPRAARASSSYANVMQVPGLTKIVVNMGVGEAARDSKLIEGAIKDLTAITGQKPQVTKARKSIAQFKLREGMPIGAHVTLRGDRMWEFLDRLLSLALPAHPRLPRPVARSSSTAAATTPSVSPSRSMFHEIDQDKIDRVARHGHHGRDHRDQRRRGSRAAQAARLPVQGELTWRRLPSKVKAARKPKFAVRGYTRCQRCGRPQVRLPQVRPVPDLPAGDGPPRRAPRRHQELAGNPPLDHRSTIAAGRPSCRRNHGEKGPTRP